jgi:hypothetical protein
MTMKIEANPIYTSLQKSPKHNEGKHIDHLLLSGLLVAMTNTTGGPHDENSEMRL